VFESHWNLPPNLSDSPGFAGVSDYCQAKVSQFSVALSEMNLEDFEPHPGAEAKDHDVYVAHEVAMSRLLPIQDGDDQWEVHKSSSATVSGAPAPG
jgi:hypothetical protein